MPKAYADDFRLPAPGVMVHLSPPLDPPMLKGIKIHPDNPFRFDFILDQGDTPSLVKEGDRGSLKQEATKLIKYFLASLTIPENDLWVNLSPYEKDRIIPNSFGLTEMGRDLLAEDYMLKQITASLIYPEGEVGKKFWKRIYEESAKKFGTTDIPVNTFNKVWIIPEKAVVYENAKAGAAYVVESKLKVMLEQDYLALEKNTKILSFPNASVGNPDMSGPPTKTLGGDNMSSLGSQIVREIVIPELTKEVNEDKNFAQLRQVYNSLILATWYKKKIKDSILEQVYADKNKVAGVGYERFLSSPKVLIGDPEYIYQQYLKAFKKGVYNYIKEEIDPNNQQAIPRKYFSGGLTLLDTSNVERIFDDQTASLAMMNKIVNTDKATLAEINANLDPVGGELSRLYKESVAMGRQVAEKIEKWPSISFEQRTLVKYAAAVVNSRITQAGEPLIEPFNPALKWNTQTITLKDRPGDEITLEFPSAYAPGDYINRINVQPKYSKLAPLTVERFKDYLQLLAKFKTRTKVQTVNSAIGHLMLGITRSNSLQDIQEFVDAFNDFIVKNQLLKEFFMDGIYKARKWLSILLLANGVLIDSRYQSIPIILYKIEGLLHVNTPQGIVEVLLIKSIGQIVREMPTAWSPFNEPYVVVSIDRLDEFIEANDIKGQAVPQSVEGLKDFMISISSKIPSIPEEQRKEMILAAIYHELGHEIVKRIAKRNNWYDVKDFMKLIPRGEEEALCDLYAIMHAENPWFMVSLRRNNILRMQAFKGWLLLQRLAGGDENVNYNREVELTIPEKEQIIKKLKEMSNNQVKDAARRGYQWLIEKITVHIKLLAPRANPPMSAVAGKHLNGQDAAMTRRQLLRSATAAGVTATLASVLIGRDSGKPLTGKLDESLMPSAIENETELLESFHQGDVFWSELTPNGHKAIPLGEQIKLGKMIKEIRTRIPIEIGEPDLRMAGKNYILLDPSHAEGEIRDLLIAESGKTRDELILDRSLGEDIYRLEMKFDGLMKKQSTVNYPDEIFRSALLDLINQMEKESVNDPGKAWYLKAVEALEKMRESSDVSDYLYRRISQEEIDKAVNKIVAQLAYVLEYFVPAFANEILGKQLKKISISYRTLSKNIMGELTSALNKDKNPYNLHAYSDLGEAQVSVNHILEIKLSGMEVRGLLHEVGHLINNILEQGNVGKDFYGTLKDIVDTLRGFTPIEYEKFFMTRSVYGHPQYTTFSNYDSSAETFANLFMTLTLAKEGFLEGKDLENVNTGETIDKQKILKERRKLHDLMRQTGWDGQPQWADRAQINQDAAMKVNIKPLRRDFLKMLGLAVGSLALSRDNISPRINIIGSLHDIESSQTTVEQISNLTIQSQDEIKEAVKLKLPTDKIIQRYEEKLINYLNNRVKIIEKQKEALGAIRDLLKKEKIDFIAVESSTEDLQFGKNLFLTFLNDYKKIWKDMGIKQPRWLMDQYLLYIFGPILYLKYNGELGRTRLVGVDSDDLKEKSGNLEDDYYDILHELFSKNPVENKLEIEKIIGTILKKIRSDVTLKPPLSDEIKKVAIMFQSRDQNQAYILLQKLFETYIAYERIILTERNKFMVQKVSGLKGRILIYVGSDHVKGLKQLLVMQGYDIQTQEFLAKEDNAMAVLIINNSRQHLENGGIDLTPANMNLQIRNSNGEIKFHLDPAMLKQLQNAPGFVPVIINIQPLKSLPEFLGIKETVGNSQGVG